VTTTPIVSVRGFGYKITTEDVGSRPISLVS